MQLCKTEILLVALSHEHSTRTSFLKWLVKRSYFPQPLGPAQCPSLTKTKESPLPGPLKKDITRFEAALFIVRKRAANLAAQQPGLPFYVP